MIRCRKFVISRVSLRELERWRGRLLHVDFHRDSWPIASSPIALTMTSPRDLSKVPRPNRRGVVFSTKCTTSDNIPDKAVNFNTYS